jgi:capsular exopolysaccharide synthesis family protein
MKEKDVKNRVELQDVEAEESGFDFRTLWVSFVLHWQWFVLSVVLCLGLAFLFLRYKSPTYSMSAKVLIKDSEKSSKMDLSGLADLSAMMGGNSSFSSGFDNELLVISSNNMAREVVKNLKLYVTYYEKGRLAKREIYSKNSPVLIDLDRLHLDTLAAPVKVQVTPEEDGSCKILVNFYKEETEYELEKTVRNLPANVSTGVGMITVMQNPEYILKSKEKRPIVAYINSVLDASVRFLGALTIEPTSKVTTVADMTMEDNLPERAMDYLNELVNVYNTESNNDKNEVAQKTAEFINGRIAEVNVELGATEDRLKSFKQSSGLFDVNETAKEVLSSTSQFQKQQVEYETQLMIIQSLMDYVNRPENARSLIPANVGVNDNNVNEVIGKHNEAVLERNRLLAASSESAPTVKNMTSVVDGYEQSIKISLKNVYNSIMLQKRSADQQYSSSNSKLSQAPSYEKELASIGRQQEVKSGLYLMLLQKREENAIQLAATADKAKMIEEPVFATPVGPKKGIILLAALVLGIAIPYGIIYLLSLLRYKIEGRNDIVQLTDVPCIADIPLSVDLASGKRSVVVRENKNDQMEEAFRSLRTNLQFVLEPGQNVILITSSMSGEGKSCVSSNLAFSLSLMGKKVLLLGVDIRKPQLAKLFDLEDKKNGLTAYLAGAKEDTATLDRCIQSFSENLDVLPAGVVPPNPSELLSKENMEYAISYLKKKYDYVLLDTAPVGLVSDTLLVARFADCCIYVCRADFTPKACFDVVNTLHENNQMPNINLVLNGVDTSSKKYGYYYGYGRYSSYGKYGRYGSYGTYGSMYGYGNDDKK